jgi:hypothetical protein
MTMPRICFDDTLLGPEPFVGFHQRLRADRAERSLTGSRANPRHRFYRGSSV